MRNSQYATIFREISFITICCRHNAIKTLQLIQMLRGNYKMGDIKLTVFIYRIRRKKNQVVCAFSKASRKRSNPFPGG